MKAKSLRHLRTNRQAFCAIRQLQDLAELLDSQAYKLSLLSANPRYRHFGIPKKDGSRRWIENPDPELKYVQRKLNFFFQCCYYFTCHPAAYGFVVNARKDKDPRNILTNAQRHLGCQYLFNADIEDFFHRISFEQVFQVFLTAPFEFDDELASLLTRICCYRERLPMGAPTSPVLSNLVCMELDRDLQSIADWAGLTYTRFADDMSFSSQDEIDESVRQKIVDVVVEHGFQFNPEKVKLMGPEDPKFVTGLRLDGKEVGLPENFEEDLQAAITKLGHAVDVQQHSGGDWLQNFQEQVEGMITFAAFILGEEAPLVLDAEQKLAQALNPDDEYSPVSWLNFGYYNEQ